jgi:Leucine-rich repeat (LRR) protein
MALTGPIPSSLSQLSALQILKLENNLLTGALPSNLFGLSNLQVLGLAGNTALTGNLEGVDGLSSLKELYIGSTSFSGRIPPSLAGCRELALFQANGAKLSSTLPSSLGSNQLTGIIPTNLWDSWTNIQEVDMSSNSFSGESALTSGIGNMKSCTKLKMSASGLGGNIPPEIGDMSSLEVLDLSSNAISGDLPSEIGQLADTVEELVLFSNSLNGTIPTEVGLLEKVSIFMLNDNGFDGEIPSEIGLLAEAELIQLDMNQLSKWCCMLCSSFKVCSYPQIQTNFFSMHHLRNSRSSSIYFRIIG